MEYVVGEVHVVMGKGASHIVSLALALFYKTLELRDYSLIASVTRVVTAEVIVYVGTSV